MRIMNLYPEIRKRRPSWKKVTPVYTVNNKINRVGDEPIHFNQFPIVRFKEVMSDINLIIIKEMIDFETKENFKRSS